MKFYLSAVILSLFFTGSVAAQTINTGDLKINPGTVFSTHFDFDNEVTGDVVNDGELILHGNFNNDGLFTFTPLSNSGFTRFESSSGAQTISGSLPSEFYSVLFNNNTIQPAFLLTGAISIAGNADFYEGIVDVDGSGGEIVFEAEATQSNTSDDSFVDGTVGRKGNNAFEFPFGDAGYFRPMAISSSGSPGNSFEGHYYLEGSDALYPNNQRQSIIEQIDKTEYWKFESQETSIDLALTLTWNENTTPATFINGNPDTVFAIVRWDVADAEWKFYPSAVDPANKTVTAAIRNDGIFTLARVYEDTPDNIVIYNGVSPNGDGMNDYFFIDGLADFPDNSLEIYNRWGVKVYDTQAYGINNNWFWGISEGRTTINKGEKLPTGTYFYVLKYVTLMGRTKDRVGYLQIN
ncbi:MULTISPECIES: gliding motility-associated C-terminal domain-containing protein [Flavobacterium]|uniref:gliding motility-associated C-terminal domain-containing protein n=1 Tax=Flavobacterium TaxID=237 RepID=UPI000869C698|nr:MULTISPECIES: gliding motility-associated C-terminal domain-containing protein [Flavobacterium]MBN9286190.1 gliding motility-associated C-terminal domain-containing protein [Flavobacterium sp.]ODS81443.1 MAG: hypothetical protein ABS44_19280 [Chryseobacterium sp. SCN 40-13]OJV73873.1 MAG: hypothetical protein BGO42_10280 [Flavobacterium sp. 40-81]